MYLENTNGTLPEWSPDYKVGDGLEMVIGTQLQHPRQWPPQGVVEGSGHSGRMQVGDRLRGRGDVMVAAGVCWVVPVREIVLQRMVEKLAETFAWDQEGRESDEIVRLACKQNFRSRSKVKTE
ncbi:hypothetical protein TIFTF001_032226 [Ficus carica]|uniref:Uncharacterized protein n=1 Tax=Ficus carica TaxID=3494 RepID=A0AA88E351_FICCA|nr:hypothetical protein TIFTF001_032226 [Ficus carica]